MVLLKSRFIRLFVKKIVSVFKKSRLLSQVVVALILLAIFIIMMLLRPSSALKAPAIYPSNATSNSLFYASNKEFSVTLGDRNTNKPVIEYSLPTGNNKISFAFSNTQGRLTAPESKNNTVTFKDVNPNVDLRYTTLPTGLKEEIILKKQIASHIFSFSLNTTNAFPQIQTDSLYSSTFFDSRGKYLFHFEKPFAIDAKGNRTNNVAVQIRKDTKTNSFTIDLNVDRTWFESPDRVYPITIDPTVVHNTSTLFSSGQFNRVKDSGSGSNPSLESYFQELPADLNTVALWRFNETSGTSVADTTTNSNTGTATGTTIVDGLLSKARNFNGTSDLVTIPDSDSLSFGNGVKDTPLTIEAWVYINSTGTGTNRVIASKYQSDNSYREWIFRVGTPGSNQVDLQLWDLSTSGIASNYTRTDVPLDQWVHLAATYVGSTSSNTNSDSIKIYFNGIEQPTEASMSSTYVAMENTAAIVKIGALENTSQQFFNGKIDEIRLSNIARSPEEILLDASRRPYSTYTSDVLDLVHPLSWTSFSWNAFGLATGDGETATPSAASDIFAQWNFNNTSGTTATNDAGTGTCGGTASNCDLTLNNFPITSGQDASPSGWTYNNRLFGAGAISLITNNKNYLSCSDANCGGTSKLDMGTSDFTLEAWVKPIASRRSGITQYIISKDSGDNLAGYDLRIDRTTGTPSATIVLAGAATVSGSTPLVPGQWYHLVATYARSSLMSIYVNGKLEGATDISGKSGSLDTASDFTIGSFSNLSNYFGGTLDVARIYRRVLTPAEIASNYNAHRLEFQTRIGSTTDPNDGSWETWMPFASETVINNMDNPIDWATPSASIWAGVPIATSSATFPLAEGTKSLKITSGIPKIDQNVVGLWHLDETNGTGAYIKDATTNANNGTPTGTTVIDGIAGKARSFNGSSDYITIGALTGGTAVKSIEFWVKPSSTSTYFLDLDGGTHYIWVNAGTITATGFTAPATFVNGIVSNTLVANVWQHVVITTATSFSASNVTLGKVSTNYFSGSLDEIRVSSSVRTPDEIAETYRMGRDHRLSETISTTDLSGANKIPFFIASDRLGTFSQLTIGESAFANGEPDANTVGLWHLDEASGSGFFIKDSSGYGNNATISGTLPVPGKVGFGRYFAGVSDYIDVGNNTSLQIGNNPQTISLWYLKQNSGTRISTHYFYTSYNGTGGELSVLLSTFLQLTVMIGGTQVLSAPTSIAPTDGSWHFIAVTYDGTNLTLYYDGSAVATTQPTGVTWDTTVNKRIGNRVGGITYAPEEGILDEVRVDKVARTPDEIRQAYEIGARSHDITIDFKAKLASGNLISDSSDFGFTVDETAYGSSLAAAHLFLGDKIIVRENYDGTEYLAQGTVNSVNASTGAVTVSSWDAASTFPSVGFSINATVFKWQREYFDITGSLSTQRNAVTRLTYRLTDGARGANIWLDDLRSSTGYLNTPTGSTVTSSLLNRYFQYRAILTQNNLSATSSALTSVSLNYTRNETPSIPTIAAAYLHDKIKTAVTTPTIRVSSTDPESEDIVYQISYDTTSAFTSAVTKTSDTDAGFADITNSSDTSPFASGDTISYTFQTALTNNTTYYYRVRAKDPSGSTQYSSWSPIRSFTIDTSIAQNQWFETMGEQFTTDTTSGTTVISNTSNSVSVASNAVILDLMEYASDGDAQTAYISSDFSITGGTVTTSGTDNIHTFTTDGTLAVPNPVIFEALVVGGGGGGGITLGGGGGAGGIVYSSSLSLSTGNYPVTVGNGGNNSNGADSVLSTMTGIGGGKGGNGTVGGSAGGNGGGAGRSEPTTNRTGGVGSQGFNGGNAYYQSSLDPPQNSAAGGGGGMGAAGLNSRNYSGGAGGIGIAYSISGESVYYAGGGGGATDSLGSVIASGGTGGGGAGGKAAVAGTSGTANTGGGGGGSGFNSSVYSSGGSGIVIVRYSTKPLLSYSDSSNKTQGSYSLKGIALAKNSLNQTLTRTLTSPISLSNVNMMELDMRSSRTGSNIKIGLHDSGGTTTEITPTVTAANTWQTVYLDLSGVSNANKDAIDKIIITVVNADADNIFYLDNFKYGSSINTGTIISTPITIANIKSSALWKQLQFNDVTTANIVYQIYYDVAGTPTIVPDSALPGNSNGFTTSPVSLLGLSTATYPTLYAKATLSDSDDVPFIYDWAITTNTVPNAPTQDSPTNASIQQAFLPTIKTTASDIDLDSLQYKILLCTNSDLTVGCQTFDQTATSSGWTAASYASGVQASYTLQTPLSAGTTYYWKTYAFDPNGSATWSATQASPLSFTTHYIPNTPSLDFPTNTVISVPLIATLKTTDTDFEGDTLQYKIILCTNAAMTTACQTFDQTSSSAGWTAASYASGVQAIYTVQSTLSPGTTYYWKSYAIDPTSSNTWSATQTTPYSFTTNRAPNTVTQDTPASTATDVTLTTIFQTTTSDVDSDYVRYKIILCTNTFMTVGCQTFDQTQSQTGWTGQDTESSTAYTSGTQATYTVQTNLLPGVLYYWRAYAIDPAGSNTWSTAQTNPQTFTSKGNPPAPAPCNTSKAIDNSNITVNWTDNATNEDNYQVWRSVNGELATPAATLAADIIQYIDSPISTNSNYTYLIRALRYDGSNTLYSNWCTTSTANTTTGGSLLFNGLKLEGVKIN